MKYIVEIKPEYEDSFKGLMILGAKDSNLFVDTLAVENLEELNSDYINEHFGDLQDTAYQKGLEEGKKAFDLLDAERNSEYQRGFEDGKKEAESSEAIEQVKKNAFNKGMLFKEEKIHDAFLRGVEKGKAVNDKGCEGCEYEGKTGEHLPCEYCKNNFRSQWTAKADKIGVGDVVETKSGTIFAVTKITADGLVVGFTGDGSNCIFGADKVLKTGRHYNINEILGGLCDD